MRGRSERVRRTGLVAIGSSQNDLVFGAPNYRPTILRPVTTGIAEHEGDRTDRISSDSLRRGLRTHVRSPTETPLGTALYADAVAAGLVPSNSSRRFPAGTPRSSSRPAASISFR